MSIFRERRSLKPAAMDPARDLPREAVTALLEDAQWAPTHGLNQPWRFHVFLAPEARARLAEGLASIYDAITPAAKRDEDKRAKLGVGPRRAAVVIALVAKVEPAGKIPEWEEMAAVACAAQNLLLSAHERGLGSFWSSPPVAASPEFVHWLGLERATHRAMGLIYLGWPLPGQPAPQSVRAPLAACTTWHAG
ncbi:MAG TPA: nitroreductase [Opitutaceae bacterium]|nr:nitroreductase [Opitutaceae bacterium]